MTDTSSFIPSFLIEDVEIQDLNGGIKKKFTSLTTTSTIFRWKFSDGNGVWYNVDTTWISTGRLQDNNCRRVLA